MPVTLNNRVLVLLGLPGSPAPAEADGGSLEGAGLPPRRLILLAPAPVPDTPFGSVPLYGSVTLFGSVTLDGYLTLVVPRFTSPSTSLANASTESVGNKLIGCATVTFREFFLSSGRRRPFIR